LLWFLEGELVFLFKVFYFGEGGVALSIDKVGNGPFLFGLVPVWVIDDGLQLIGCHKLVEDGGVFTQLFGLLTNGVEEGLFLVLVLFV
jgi:hypothetical protein